jgi:hypothetical protein
MAPANRARPSPRGTNSSGYTLTSLSIRTAGLGNYKGIGTPSLITSTFTPCPAPRLHLLQTYTSANVTFNDGDWLQWSGLSVPMAANTTYAWSFGMASSAKPAGKRWASPAAILYAGGQIGLIPVGGGTMTFGGSHGFDAVFDVGLAPANWPASTKSPCRRRTMCLSGRW